MAEFYTKGLVLDREPKSEIDENIILYTLLFGKVRARVKSVKKITSKLSGHLTPGNLIDARLVERNNGELQLVDALTLGLKPAASADWLRLLNFLNRLTPQVEADVRLWAEIERLAKRPNDPFDYREVLNLLGFGAEFASCAHCGGSSVDYFIVDDTIFLCASCYSDFLIFGSRYPNFKNDAVKI